MLTSVSVLLALFLVRAAGSASVRASRNYTFDAHDHKPWSASTASRLRSGARTLQQSESAPVRVSSPAAFPFKAVGALYVKYQDGNTAQCSAALVAANAILTAGHCAWNVDTGDTTLSAAVPQPCHGHSTFPSQITLS